MLNQPLFIREQDEELVQLELLQANTPQNAISLSTSPESNLILIVARGLWTFETLASHYQELESAFLSKRRHFETIRVLSDISEQSTQSLEMLEGVKAGMEQLYMPVDRLATVTGSSLAKIQLRQQSWRMNAQYFMSVAAAKIWLDAYH